VPARDNRAGAADDPSLDPRVSLLVDECWRHAKAIGAWGLGGAVLRSAGIAGLPGIVVADSGTETLGALTALMAAHRVWERFPATVS
jgi:catalase